MTLLHRFIFAGLFFLTPLWAADLDPYLFIESLMPRDQLPRLLNTDDLIDLNPNDPQPLVTPSGDFNGDGTPDLALSGIYGLPNSKKKFFLLVGTQYKSPVRYKKLYFREFHQPVYLHQAGTTGDGDPGDQAFSVSFCAECDKGKDFYWNKKQNRFSAKTWAMKTQRTQRQVEVPSEQVPEAIVDQALQLVSGLKEVQQFIQDVKKRKGQLATQVDFHKKGRKKNLYWVKIFEKTATESRLYGSILVDVKKNKVIKKKRTSSNNAQ